MKYVVTLMKRYELEADSMEAAIKDFQSDGEEGHTVTEVERSIVCENTGDEQSF